MTTTKKFKLVDFEGMRFSEVAEVVERIEEIRSKGYVAKFDSSGDIVFER